MRYTRKAKAPGSPASRGPALRVLALFLACFLFVNLPFRAVGTSWSYRVAEKLRLLRAGILPIVIFAAMMVPFINGWTSLVESSAIGAMAAFLAAVLKGRMTREFVHHRQDIGPGDVWACGMWEPHGSGVKLAPCEVVAQQ